MNTQELSAKYNAEMPQNIREYLNNRGITDEAIEKFQLGYGLVYGSNWITIPIKDSDGEIKFFKLRRDPFNDLANPSKYMTYKHGDAVEGESASGIFNEELLNTNPEIIVITEGEFDCMLLNSRGIPSISFTTGAGTLAERLVDKLKDIKTIAICYDNDQAGKEGMEKLARRLYETLRDSEINVINLGDLIDYEGDITDFIINSENGEDKLVRAIKKYLPSELITAKSLCAKHFNNKDKWIISRILPQEGITLISSQPKSYKTWMILYMAKCLSEGTPLFNKFNCKKSKVLIINEENSDRLIHDRSNKIGLNESNDVIFRNLHGIRIDKKEDIRYLQSLIERERFNVMVFDNLVRVHGKEENSASEMRIIFENLKELLKMGTSIIITHHQNKGYFSTGSRGYRGSSEISAFVSCGFSIEKTRENNKIILINDLCRDDVELEKIAIEIDINDEATTFNLLDKKEAFDLLANEIVNDIYSTINKSEQPLNIRQLMEQMQTKPSQKTIERYSKELQSDGLIKISKGSHGANIYSRE